MREYKHDSSLPLRGHMKRIPFVLFVIVMPLISSCEKEKTKEASNQAVLNQTASNQAVSNQSIDKAGIGDVRTPETTLKKIINTGISNGDTANAAEGQPELIPLEMAKGREKIAEDGLPVVVWDDWRKLPTLDDAFPSMKEIPEGNKEIEQVHEVWVPETEERKNLRTYVQDEIEDMFYAIRGPSKDCIVEIFAGYLPGDKREVWIRGLHPETYEVLWKVDEPELAFPETKLYFAFETDKFIITNLPYRESRTDGYFDWAVKLYSCKDGFIRNLAIIKAEEADELNPMGYFSPMGDKIILRDKKEMKSIDLEGNINWKVPNRGGLIFQQIALSSDGEYLLTSWHKQYIKDEMNSKNKYMLISMSSGKTLWEKMVYYNLGDEKASPVNRGATVSLDGSISAIWKMDAEYYQFEMNNKNKQMINPYMNLILLIDKTGAMYAFRTKSLGVHFPSKNPAHLSAEGKVYDISRMIVNSGEEK